MSEISDLIYTLEINYTNNSWSNNSITLKIYDNGLEVKSVRVGDFCIIEKTINGRILSGELKSSNEYCGYMFDYQNGETLLNLNPKVHIDTAVSLINNKKMESDFLSAKLVLSSIMRNDYRVVILNKGSLNIIKTISAINEKSEHYGLQEKVDLLKLDGDESFVEQNKKVVYQMDDKCVVEENATLVDSNIKSQLNELSYILNQNPQNYKELIKFKNQIKKITINNSINGEKML